MQAFNNFNNICYSSDSLCSESVEEINTSYSEDVIRNLSATLQMLQKHRFRRINGLTKGQEEGFEEAIDDEKSTAAKSGSGVEPKSAPVSDKYYKATFQSGNQEGRPPKLFRRDEEHSNLDGYANGAEKSNRPSGGKTSRLSVQAEHHFTPHSTKTCFEPASFDDSSFEQRFEHNMTETGKLFDISSSNPLDDPDFINLGKLDDESSIDSEVFTGQTSPYIRQKHAKHPCATPEKCRKARPHSDEIFKLMIRKKMRLVERDAEQQQSGLDTRNSQKSSNRSPTKRGAVQREEMFSNASNDSIVSFGRVGNRVGKGCLDTLSERVKRKVWSAFCMTPALEGDTGVQEYGRTLEIQEKGNVGKTGVPNEKKNDAERCLEMAKFYVEECDDVQKAIDLLQKGIEERNEADADSKGLADLLDYYAQLLRRVAVASVY